MNAKLPFTIANVDLGHGGHVACLGGTSQLQLRKGDSSRRTRHFADAELSRLDNIANTGFKFLRWTYGRERANSIALPLLRERQACGSEVSCIKTRQLATIQTFRLLGAPVDDLRQQMLPDQMIVPKSEQPTAVTPSAEPADSNLSGPPERSGGASEAATAAESTPAQQWETLPVRIGAFHEAFNQIAKGGTTDLLAETGRCGRSACFYQLTDLDGSVASKVILAAGQPENNASSIELQAPVTLAQNTLGAAVITVVQIAAPQLSATARLHVMQSLFADMANPQMIGPGGAACVDLVPGHWMISGYVFDRVVYIRIMWPSGTPRGLAGKCRHLLPADEVLAPNQFVPSKAQQTINDCERDAACWMQHYPEVPGWCLHALFNRGELQALSVTEAHGIDETPREARWAAWPVFVFTGRWAKRTQPQGLSPLIMVEYNCTYDPLAQQVVDARLLPTNSNPVRVPSPTVNDFLPRGAH
jgi:hypothetical protein